MNTKKVLTPILVAILALGAVSTIGFKSPIQHAAAASVLIATSADSHGGKFFGEGVLQVVVTDPDKNDDNTRETIQVTIQGDPESGSGGSKTFTIPETSESSSKFEFYLRHKDATAVDNGDIDAINNAGVDDYPTTTKAPMIKFGSGVGSSGLDIQSSMYELTHFTITVGDTEAKVDYDDSKSSIALDRTTYGSDNKMHIFITDQDANRNPTTAENWTVTQSELNTKLFSMTGATFVDDVDFKETGDNTAEFEAVVTLNDADTSTIQELKYTTKGVQMTLNDKWDYYNLGSSHNDNATSTSDIALQ